MHGFTCFHFNPLCKYPKATLYRYRHGRMMVRSFLTRWPFRTGPTVLMSYNYFQLRFQQNLSTGHEHAFWLAIQQAAQLSADRWTPNTDRCRRWTQLSFHTSETLSFFGVFVLSINFSSPTCATVSANTDPMLQAKSGIYLVDR